MAAFFLAGFLARVSSGGFFFAGALARLHRQMVLALKQEVQGPAQAEDSRRRHAGFFFLLLLRKILQRLLRAAIAEFFFITSIERGVVNVIAPPDSVAAGGYAGCGHEELNDNKALL